MADEQVTGPDQTAVRVALWRAMHVQVDASPNALEDVTGPRLADPDPAGACAYTAAARRHASALESAARERHEVVLADVARACVDDLQRVIDLRQR